MAYELPKLPYDYAALEPHIDEATMKLHHDKHHQGYVNNLNAAIEKHPELASHSAEDLVRNLNTIPEDIRTAVRNNGGGHVNHTMFWSIMKPNGGGAPTGAIADQIKQDFGSFEDFKTAFNSAAGAQFGSGWGWLVQRPDGSLALASTSNAATPLTGEDTALLTCDVWEHAYYIDYRNARPKYVEAFWNLVNWDFVASNMK